MLIFLHSLPHLLTVLSLLRFTFQMKKMHKSKIKNDEASLSISVTKKSALQESISGVDTVGLTRFYWILSSNPAILVEILTRITEFEERIQ